MSWWPRICPVCGDELPERGNRRVRVPGKPGMRLVHAGACFDAIDAQAVLDLEAKPKPLNPVLLARYRAAVAAYPGELPREEQERLVARNRDLVALVAKALVREEDVEGVHERRERILGYARRYLARLHAREVCADPRTAAIPWGGSS